MSCISIGRPVAASFPFILAAVMSAAPVHAQDSDQTEAERQEEEREAALAFEELDEIVVTGIRGSLQRAMDTKRYARGVVDAITAEDMGKFPDTNLAESLQRITGVSIDRTNGEGSRVTVRGFGPDFNLVTFNGRQMPVSSIADTGASGSRSFDFANIASEGVAAVNVYKTGRASIPLGGLGSTIDVRTTRPLENPGMKATFGSKIVLDNSRIDDTGIGSEFSGLYSNTTEDGKFGIALTGSFQDRESGFAQAGATSGWRGPFRGDSNDWGALPQPPNNQQVTNPPGPDDIFATPQNMNYNINDIDRTRINGQVTLQWQPVDNLTATVDFTYAEFEIETRRNDMSIWFNHGNTTSAWTDGPVVGPLFYAERFDGAPTDLSFGGGLFASRNENNSLGGNIEWKPTSNLTLELDAHSSSASSKQDSPFGSNAVLGTASFNVVGQGVNFEEAFPVISIDLLNDSNEVDPSQIVVTGNSFRNSFMRNEIDQAQFSGQYEFDTGIVKSINFGAAYLDSRVRSAFANVQDDTWGGKGPASDVPDDMFSITTVSDKFSNIEGSDNPDLFNQMAVWNFEEMIALVDQTYGTCGGNGVCRSDDFTTDRRTQEESISFYAEANAEFDILDMPSFLTVGLRYEDTDVTSRALVPIPTGTQWVAENEFGIIFSDERDFTELKGGYDNFLPAIDFSMDVMRDVVFRASFSQTLTRPSLNAIQGGQELNQLFRVDGGTASRGDPNLLPFKSDNLDFSAEYYYAEASFFSVGYFHKNVKNFISQDVVQETPFDLVTPFGGERFEAAQAALGPDATTTEIRQYIFNNADPSTVEITGVDANGNLTGSIFGVPGEDPALVFDVFAPVNNEQTATVRGWEIALQHAFGESGFGFIANYTSVGGDVDFDVTAPPEEVQFALEGLSDSANLIGFYDKDGFQARVAYNWRGKFLASRFDPGGSRNAMFTEGFTQVDANVSYDFADGWTVLAEGINIFNSNQRVSGRHENILHFVTQTGARYNFGLRYKF
ncbi:TonB-dependent receptor [Yunchengibacter salinarum]|uniref:TonB-dependent receptor n=1 Tax=Yunchengibacter salinarum TaxID=3133399 RepID=UPI0035B692F4